MLLCLREWPPIELCQRCADSALTPNFVQSTQQHHQHSDWRALQVCSTIGLPARMTFTSGWDTNRFPQPALAVAAQPRGAVRPHGAHPHRKVHADARALPRLDVQDGVCCPRVFRGCSCFDKQGGTQQGARNAPRAIYKCEYRREWHTLCAAGAFSITYARRYARCHGEC